MRSLDVSFEQSINKVSAWRITYLIGGFPFHGYLNYLSYALLMKYAHLQATENDDFRPSLMKKG